MRLQDKSLQMLIWRLLRALEQRLNQRFDFFAFFFFATFLAVFFLPTAFRPADDLVFLADFLEDFLAAFAAAFFGAGGILAGESFTGAFRFFFGAGATGTSGIGISAASGATATSWER